jgi:hypothetical protein
VRSGRTQFPVVTRLCKLEGSGRGADEEGVMARPREHPTDPPENPRVREAPPATPSSRGTSRRAPSTGLEEGKDYNRRPVNGSNAELDAGFAVLEDALRAVAKERGVRC